MNFLTKLHFLHSAWHYRLNTEKNDIQFLLNLNLEEKTIIDIGANKGIYSYWMCKKTGPQGKVFSFEPQPELLLHLKELKNTFKFNNLVLINKGLSTTSGISELYRPEPGSGGASLNRTNTNENWQKIEVELTTLDSFYEDFKNVAFIKCDVEGHELSVFKGGQRLLERDKPCLLFECHHDDAKEQNLFSYLTGLGYDGFFFHGKKMIHFSEFSNYPYRNENQHHRNYIFFHNDVMKKTDNKVKFKA